MASQAGGPAEESAWVKLSTVWDTLGVNPTEGPGGIFIQRFETPAFPGAAGEICPFAEESLPPGAPQL